MKRFLVWLGLSEPKPEPEPVTVPHVRYRYSFNWWSHPRDWVPPVVSGGPRRRAAFEAAWSDLDATTETILDRYLEQVVP